MKTKLLKIYQLIRETLKRVCVFLEEKTVQRSKDRFLKKIPFKIPTHSFMKGDLLKVLLFEY